MSTIFNCGGGEPVNKEQGACAKAKFVLPAIVAIVLGILGGLAVAGVFYPHSALGGLGDAFGQIGALSTIGAGLVVFAVTAVVWSCCSNKNNQTKSKEERENRGRERSPTPPASSSTGGIPRTNPTGAGGGGSRVSYFNGSGNFGGDYVRSATSSEEESSSS